VLFSDGMLHGIPSHKTHTYKVKTEELIKLSQGPHAGDLFLSLLQVFRHPVQPGHNGCNLKMYNDVARKILELMQFLNEHGSGGQKGPKHNTTLNSSFPTQFEDFMKNKFLDASIKAFADLDKLTENETSFLGQVARKTKLCLDSFPVTRCEDTKSAEANRSITAMEGDERWLLDGDCICSNTVNQKHHRTPLFNYTSHVHHHESSGEEFHHCQADEGSPCSSISSVIECENEEMTGCSILGTASPFGTGTLSQT